MKMKRSLGGWAFLIGILIAVLAGIFVSELSASITGVLVVIGIIVGLFNVTGKESHSFLLATVALVIVSSLGGQVISSSIAILGNILRAFLVLIVPATIVVAIREAFSVAKS